MSTCHINRKNFISSVLLTL